MTRKRARPTRLPPWQEWAVYFTLGLLIVTGLSWLALHQWVRVEGEFGSESHPAERLSLIAHGIAAYLFLVIAGALIPVHIKLGWSMGKNIKSGLALASGCTLLAFTALGLYYIGEEQLRSLASIAHWVAGIAIFPLLLVHAVRGRRRS